MSSPKDILCPICGKFPIKYDKQGRSCGACQACVTERVRRANQKRTNEYRRMARVAELAVILQKTQNELDCARSVTANLFHLKEADSLYRIELLAEAYSSISVALGALVTSLTILAKLGGIPGWKDGQDVQ